MADIVTISLKAYNDLRDSNAELTRENLELETAINELQEAEGQRVIVREIHQFSSDDGEEYVHEETKLKCFEDVKAEVEEFYKKKTEDLTEQIKCLNQTIESMKQTGDALSKKALGMEIEISRLKHRNLWQRILNK